MVWGMPPFDPIASPTVRIASHREPAFGFPDQANAARDKLAAFRARGGTATCGGTGNQPDVPGAGRNLYLDPKETHSYLTRKLAYVEVLREGMRAHLATFQA